MAWLLAAAVAGSCGSDPKAGEPIEAAKTEPHQQEAVRKEADPPPTPPSDAPPTMAAPTRPMPLFDGKDKALKGWRVVKEVDFEMHGKVYVKDGTIVLETGSPMTGISWTSPFPTEDYEVTLEAMRVEGSDFFCGMTFPVGDAPLTLILGGWGGCVVGLSNVDHMHAAENETTSSVAFENGRWYRVRLRVTKDRIEAWIDDQQKIDLEREGRGFTIWDEQQPVRPFGIATWYTKAALRNIVLRGVTPRP